MAVESISGSGTQTLELGLNGTLSGTAILSYSGGDVEDENGNQLGRSRMCQYRSPQGRCFPDPGGPAGHSISSPAYHADYLPASLQGASPDPDAPASPSHPPARLTSCWR